LSFIVNIDGTESLGIASCPLKVIQQRPLQVSSNRDASLGCLPNRTDMRFEVIDAILIMDSSIFIRPIRITGAIFCDHELLGLVIAVDALQQLVKTLWIKFPTHLSLWDIPFLVVISGW